MKCVPEFLRIPALVLAKSKGTEATREEFPGMREACGGGCRECVVVVGSDQ